MAFGIKRHELETWKRKVRNGEIAFLTHYWIYQLDPSITTVTKAGCADLSKLIAWGKQYGLRSEWVHSRSDYPHFDLIGARQLRVLRDQRLFEHIRRFGL